MDDLFNLVQQLVFNVTGRKNLTLDTDFVKDLELNSLDVMNLICAFEDHFSVSIPTRDVWNLHQVKDVIDYMVMKGV